MSVIVSFYKLPAKYKKVAVEAIFWVILIRLLIWIFSFDFVKKKIQKIASHYTPTTKHTVSMSRLRLLIMSTARYIPRATCLVQALAGYILFSKYGYTTSIKIGVLNENGEFEAHAWLENGNSVVLGESEKYFITIMDISGNKDSKY